MKWNYKKVLHIIPVIFAVYGLLMRLLGNFSNLWEFSLLEMLKSVLITFPLDFITFLVFYYFFALRFFKKQKLILNISWAVLYVMLWPVLWVVLFRYLGVTDKAIWVLYISSMGHAFVYLVYGLVARISLEWFQEKRKKDELEKQNVKTELALLRSQINPHFLFNSLNNIHAYSKKDPDKSGFAIIKLSEIMRYMLYDANKEYVHLYKEIKYISDFLELQKMRFDFNFIDYQVSDVPEQVLIAPLVFIPFVENSFKHGRKDENTKIRIRIHYNNGLINFECFNFIRKSTHTEEKQIGGIGIKNIKRRLELIYPNRYELEISHNKKEYHVKLSLNIL